MSTGRAKPEHQPTKSKALSGGRVFNEFGDFLSDRCADVRTPVASKFDFKHIRKRQRDVGALARSHELDS
jgi:hypothetical protein